MAAKRCSDARSLQPGALRRGPGEDQVMLSESRALLRAGGDPKLARRRDRLVHIRSDVPMDKQTALTWRKKPSRRRCNHTFTRGEEINYARNHALRPPGRALRGASRPNDDRTDGRHHPNLGGLRVRVRPVA